MTKTPLNPFFIQRVYEALSCTSSKSDEENVYANTYTIAKQAPNSTWEEFYEKIATPENLRKSEKAPDHERRISEGETLIKILKRMSPPHRGTKGFFPRRMSGFRKKEHEVIAEYVK